MARSNYALTGITELLGGKYRDEWRKINRENVRIGRRSKASARSVARIFSEGLASNLLLAGNPAAARISFSISLSPLRFSFFHPTSAALRRSSLSPVPLRNLRLNLRQGRGLQFIHTEALITQSPRFALNAAYYFIVLCLSGRKQHCHSVL